MEQETFLSLSTEEIADIVKHEGLPKVGIFVPDGNRRLVLAATDLQEGTTEFYQQLARTHTSKSLNILQIFFGYGLQILFIPMFSHSVLQRGENYCQLVVLKTLQTLFTDETWLAFYDQWDVRVKVYGNASVLSEVGCHQAIDWIRQIMLKTEKHSTHTLFFGIGGESMNGYDAAVAGASFYQHFQCPPSPDELVRFYYGQSIPPADFYIMSSKLGGLGAIPPLVCGKPTRVYFLPVPGVMGLTERTYRQILYDLLYPNEITSKSSNSQLNTTERTVLRSWYHDHAFTVVGLRQRIGSVNVFRY